jgi:peptide chain release factor 2
LQVKENRLAELSIITQQDSLWNDGDQAKIYLKEQADLEQVLKDFKNICQSFEDFKAALDLARETQDPEFIEEARKSLEDCERALSAKEFMCKMRGEFDSENAIIEINAGAGGTESQDWAEMLLRMYLRWAERKGFEMEELDYQAGEGAGIKRCSISIKGSYVYGLLRSERGVHRLVRISPFDSNARRHTSFASVMVSPDIEKEVDIIIDDKDLRVDTYRAGGKGGQHVNKTDSAVRLTHMPSGIVVACQNERSQIKNKDRAMKILKAKLFEAERIKQQEQISSIEGQRRKIDFGSQIRSYVLQPYQMIKDLRTDHETSSVDAVLDGDIDPFIESYLLSPENQSL